tara:strand:+ start:247 stop:357 length:111 start_codon:yes stop_codon:yes gene_type:complete
MIHSSMLGMTTIEQGLIFMKGLMNMRLMAWFDRYGG